MYRRQLCTVNFFKGYITCNFNFITVHFYDYIIRRNGKVNTGEGMRVEISKRRIDQVHRYIEKSKQGTRSSYSYSKIIVQ